MAATDLLTDAVRMVQATLEGVAADGEGVRGALAAPREEARHLAARALAAVSGDRGPAPAAEEGAHLLDRLLRNVQRGRFERSMSGLTAVSAVITTVEVYYEHYKGAFGHKMMWSPIVLTPPLVAAGVGGVFSRKVAKTWLPLFSALYALDGMIGEYYHVRGIGRRPGGFDRPVLNYNIAMGPPLLAPGLFSMVGGMGLLAAALRRER